MRSFPSARSWTDIVAFRQRDRLIILPMTLLAALAASVWLGPRFAIAWFASNVAMMVVSKALCARLVARPAPDRRPEAALAAFTFAATLIYSSMPFGLVIGGSQAGTIAGVAMLCAVALSCIGEFVISRMVGGAALAALFMVTVAGAAWRSGETSWVNTAFALASVISFFGYVIQSALHREKTEVQMREALAAARRAENEAASANAAKSAFLATMSHEIRTPLNGVLGMAQAMEAEAMSEAQRERVAVILQSGQTLTAILNDVLDLAKVEAGRLSLEVIAFDIGEVLRAARSAFAALAAGKGLALTLEIDPDAEGVYLGDPTRVRQVMYNLISNGVKFTDAGSVCIRAQRGETGLLLSVSDTGVGIEDDQTDKLFSKFVQLDASTTRRHGGTGLGLAICRELCALMGGEITVESRRGHGTTFTVALPLKQVASPAHEAPSEPAASPEFRTLRVLAAEDNAVNQLVLRTLMRQVGVDPVVVDNGALAVEAWTDGDWDLVLMDVQMPVMDGLEALRAIRAREAAEGRARTPVVALTANAMVHQIAELRAAGADAHVSKPIDVTAFFVTLETVLAGPSATEPAGRAALG